LENRVISAPDVSLHNGPMPSIWNGNSISNQQTVASKCNAIARCLLNRMAILW
jgi:hypothetical protein